MFAARRNLGLAVTEQGLTAVEVGTAGGRRTLLHTAVLAFSDALNLEEPQRLGKELRQVLRRGGVQASRCVIGLAANWTATREKLLPVADDESLRGILSLAAEREFASGPQELALDYCRYPSQKGISALMVAAPRRVIGQLSAMAEAAGLSLAATTSSPMALALMTKGPIAPPGRLVLCLLARGVELAVQSVQGVHLLRHLPVRLDRAGAETGDLVDQLQRVLALAPARAEADQVRELLIWDSLGLGQPALESIGRSLSVPWRLCRLPSDLEATAASPAPPGDDLAQAAALACFSGPPPLDFLHSRLAPRKKARVGRWVLWAAVACLTVLAAGLYLLLDWRADQRAVANLRQQLAELRDGAQHARTLVQDVSFAGAWYDHRPKLLDCLWEITQAFPDEGRIWATSLRVQEDMQLLLSGKSVTEAAALEVRDRLQANPRLANVKQLYLRKAEGASREVSFAISMRFRGAD